MRFVLTSSGHIAGIVNPPGPKRSHFLNDELAADPDTWLAGATEVQGSWWEDWAEWIGERAGERQEGYDGEDRPAHHQPTPVQTMNQVMSAATPISIAKA